MSNYVLMVRRYAPMKSFGGGFEGDGRAGASTSLTATARTSASVGFSLAGVASSTGGSSGTSYVGPWECLKDTRLSRWVGSKMAGVRVTLSNVRTTATSVNFTVYSEGANPMVPGAPDIDTFVDFEARLQSDRALFRGTVRGDGFPNAEVFLVDPAGNTLLLLDFRTKSGDAGPFTRLMGSGAGNKLADFSQTVALGRDGTLGARMGGSNVLLQEA